MNTYTLSLAVGRADAAMDSLEQMLNEADARLGDGDTGGMLARVITKMAEAELEPSGDLGIAFATLARAALLGTGSSLGTLLATGLLAFAKACEGRTDVPAAEFSMILAGARDAMLARGRASLGDKTVLDALDAIVNATAGLSDANDVAKAASSAASKALDDFRDRPCRIGRARMFGDKSVGIDDPGMLAVERLAHSITAQ